jgi:plasmid stability protein
LKAVSSTLEEERRLKMATLNIENLPDSLYEALKARAESQHRSLAQEVTHLLTDALGHREPLSILELEGLGKELWIGIDAAKHVEAERVSWD